MSMPQGEGVIELFNLIPQRQHSASHFVIPSLKRRNLIMISKELHLATMHKVY